MSESIKLAITKIIDGADTISRTFSLNVFADKEKNYSTSGGFSKSDWEKVGNDLKRGIIAYGKSAHK